jgi:hypothetical protein
LAVLIVPFSGALSLGALLALLLLSFVLVRAFLVLFDDRLNQFPQLIRRNAVCLSVIVLANVEHPLDGWQPGEPLDLDLQTTSTLLRTDDFGGAERDDFAVALICGRHTLLLQTQTAPAHLSRGRMPEPLSRARKNDCDVPLDRQAATLSDSGCSCPPQHTKIASS